MKVLLTGAFGNLGTMCIEQGLEMGYSLRCFDIDNPHNRKIAEQFGDRIEVVYGDIRNGDSLLDLVEGVDAIIHNASLLPPLTDTKPELADAINVVGCKHLIRAAESLDKKPVFIFPSSVTTFGLGKLDGERKPEDPVEATDNYTRHKITIEQELKKSKIPWVILRVGVSVDARTLSTDRKTFKTLLDVRPDNHFEYVHPRDVALAMCKAAAVEQAHGKILLIGGGKSCQVTQRKFLSAAFNSLGLKLPESVHGNNPYYTHWMDTTESQALLQFQRHDFNDYLEEMSEKLKPVSRILWPLRWLVNPLLGPVLKRL